MKRLVLHVGHGKTGSSYLQSIFAINKDYLRSHDIDYLAHPSLERAVKGEVTAGNGDLIFQEQLPVSECETIFLSSEGLYRKLIYDRKLNELVENFSLDVVIYTRDIIEHSVSKWAQYVKRRGVHEDVSTWLMDTPNDVLQVLTDWIYLSESSGFNLIVRNYSSCKNSLIEDFFKNVFGHHFCVDQLSTPRVEKINRGLTNSEYDIQRLFNLVIGKESSEYISDFLVKNFPNEKAAKIKISEAAFSHLRSENAALLEDINRIMPDGHKLKLGDAREWVDYDGSSCIESDIMNKLGENVSHYFTSFERRQSEAMRDVSNKIATTYGDLESALVIMEISLQNKPNPKDFLGLEKLIKTHLDQCAQTLQEEGVKPTSYLKKLSVELAKKGSLYSAKATIEKSISLGDQRHSTYRHASNICRRLGDGKAALLYAKNAVGANDNSEVSRWNHTEHLANILCSIGELTAACEVIDELLARDSRRYSAYIAKANILAKLCDFSRAKQVLMKSIELGDVSNATYRQASNICYELKDHESAIFFAKQAIEAKDNTETSQINHEKHLQNLMKQARRPR